MTEPRNLEEPSQMTQQIPLSRKERNEILVCNAVLKWKLSHRDGERCYKCKTRMYTSQLTIDHIQPKFLNGSEDFANKQLLCLDCHRKKSRLEQLLTKKNRPDLVALPSSFWLIHYFIPHFF